MANHVELISLKLEEWRVALVPFIARKIQMSVFAKENNPSEKSKHPRNFFHLCGKKVLLAPIETSSHTGNFFCQRRRSYR